MISNCGHDENNRYSGGKAGDQTRTEWRVINWYNRPWKCVLRHPDAKVRKMIASMAKAAAVNDKIGYDQSERYTFWEHLKASNYDPAQITIACEADCSSGVAAIVKGAGYRLGNEKMKNVSIYLYTGNMRAGLKAAGFEVLTDSKYLTSDAYLLEGDILLNDNAHVATNLTTGSMQILMMWMLQKSHSRMYMSDGLMNIFRPSVIPTSRVIVQHGRCVINLHRCVLLM